jgi:hypothetical protein
MDITPRDQQWLIETSALWNGRDPVAQFPAQVVPSFEAVQAGALGILEQLLQAGVAVLDKVMARAAAADKPAGK